VLKFLAGIDSVIAVCGCVVRCGNLKDCNDMQICQGALKASLIVMYFEGKPFEINSRPTIDDVLEILKYLADVQPRLIP
jgi:hypothetical protein